jgi:pimeloyl-ACP methyl ester carboxylesterase
LVDLGGLFGRFNALPIEDVARAVAARVERLLRDHRLQHIDVVGHSKGGLIGRYYIQKLGGAARVRHLVTLGTPHRGTPWAYSGYALRRIPQPVAGGSGGTPARRALRRHVPARGRLTSIYSQRDRCARQPRVGWKSGSAGI